MNRRKLISVLLYGGVAFYVIGAIVHFLGLSVYPWFVAALYSPYHDTLIAISSLAMAIFFFQAARHPDNRPLLNAIIAATFIGGPLIIAMGLFIDFTELGAAAKGTQAVIEGCAALLLGIALVVLNKKRNT